MASVNLSEEGHVEVMAALVAAGVGIEAGLWQRRGRRCAAGQRLRRRAHARAGRARRGRPRRRASPPRRRIDDALDAAGIAAPRVHHGFGIATWDVLRRAKALGHGWRVGLEDTLVLPDGRHGGLQRRAGQRGAGAVIARTTTLARSCAVATSSRQQPAFGTSMIDANDGALRWPP